METFLPSLHSPFVFCGDGKVKNSQLNKIPNLYDIILDSLVNHIPRALAEYSLLLDSRRTERLAGLRTQTFFEF